MKILVCVSKTPDTTAKISFSADATQFNGAGVQFIMNPYDEWYALVRAIDLAKATGGTVTLINVGGADNDQIIRKGLALDANDAVRINLESQSAMNTAFQIAEYAKSRGYDVIFTGKETIDYNGSEIGAMVAEYLDMPFISYASKLDMSGNTATIERDIEGGIEVVEVETPFVISAAKGMAEQRIPNMMGIMKAKSKPLAVVEPQAFTDNSVVTKFDMPPAKSGVKMVSPDDMEELVRLLHEESKVI
ncbi:MAG: electron transfer flavoprotein subunit beta/FixA family protein [Saprospiraceae bacterium]|nr:electron transfer flavoprotein subunit beta/FixA family protein [Saprospiraceae bacterium]